MASTRNINMLILVTVICSLHLARNSAGLESVSGIKMTTTIVTDTNTSSSSSSEEQSTAAESSDTNNQTMLLGVYFESLCPDSRRFFLDQLIPTYRQIGAIMSLQLIPFGKARTLGGNKMICQHGQRECDGNRLMACVQRKAASSQEDAGKVLETIGCVFKGDQSDKECIGKFLPTVSFESIEKCKSSEESYKMMQEYESVTGRLSYVPKLTFNGESSGEIQNDLEYDLKAFLCKKYTGPSKPGGCAQQE